jgi:hypothetical protein
MATASPMPAPAGAGTLAKKIGVLAGKGDGSFATPLTLTAGAAPRAVVAADPNTDGKLDLVAVARDAKKPVMLRNTTT